jgi:hypothetical protein
VSRSSFPPAAPHGPRVHYAVTFRGELVCLNDSREHAQAIAHMFGAGFAVVERAGALPHSVKAAVRSLNATMDREVAASPKRPALRLIRGGA